MDIATNSSATETVIWIGKAVESESLVIYNLLINGEIECVYNLDRIKIDQILTNFSLFIRYKSDLVKKYQIIY